MRALLALTVLLAAVVTHVFFHSGVWEDRAKVRAATPASYVIPSKFSRILAMGHQGLLSDVLFLKTITFFGGKSVSGSSLQPDDWLFVIRSLEVITDLDPYFVDPYFLAEGLLAWDAGMPQEANRIIDKGIKYRTKDWRLPFFAGFNSFYFLHDYASASDYIMKAARLPGSPDYFPTLAARLAYYGGKSKTGLLFLRQMIAETDNVVLRKRLEMRLLAIERAVSIEEALERFKKTEGRLPEPLEELVAHGYLKELPVDPYGGNWGIMDNGRVFSSSRFAETPPVKKGGSFSDH